MQAALLQELQQAQYLRHLLANKLTLPLTLLDHLQAGKSATPRLFGLAIRDLKNLVEIAKQEAQYSAPRF